MSEEENFEGNVKEFVKYILSAEPTDDKEVIEQYTNTMMFICEEYHELKQLNNGNTRIRTL